MEIKKYNSEIENIWDNFIFSSFNGTIYHTRKFLNYHKNKFIDESILIYDNNILVCVVPCCKNGEKYFSHYGATYGGPVFKQNNLKDMKKIVELIFKYYENKIEFRIASNIYFKESQNKLFYLMNKLNIKLELSWFIDTNDNWFLNLKNKRNQSYLNKFSLNHEITIASSDQDYVDFYKILEKNLNQKHKSNPTHTLEELIIFKNQLENYQKLYLVKEAQNILGGVLVVKVTKECWYTFYISKNIDLNNPINCSIPFIMKNITIDARKENVKFLDYGITTEERGEILNDGLSNFKEETLGGKSDYRYNFIL